MKEKSSSAVEKKGEKLQWVKKSEPIFQEVKIAKETLWMLCAP